MKKIFSTTWKKLAFANYIVPAEILEKYLPEHTKLDFFNGNCFVSLVGYTYSGVEIANLKVPFLSNFEEIDLRFYVKRFDGAAWRKGTVAITRILNTPGLEQLKSALFEGKLSALSTSGKIEETMTEVEVKYSWTYENDEKFMRVKSSKPASPFQKDSASEFLLDRPYVYQRLGDDHIQEIMLEHASWHLYPVEEYTINVDFSRQFDPVFSLLNSATPHSVILAEGSAVAIYQGQMIQS